jgi:hypothetical protein
MAAFDPAFCEKSPLFWPISAAARAFEGCPVWPSVAEYGTRLAHRAPVRFREQAKKPRGSRRRGPIGARDLYDGRIVCEGWVPTRPGSWHDFLNMLVWATFPAAKWQLHQRQHAALSARLAGAFPLTMGPPALPNARTREQDALALLDEGGVVLACRSDRAAELTRALAERRADDARALFASGAARAVIFGHALYESLVLGRDENGWAAAHVAGHDGALEEDPQELVRFADASLGRALAAEGSFQTPEALSRIDLAVIRL